MNENFQSLSDRKCKPCHGDTPALSEGEIAAMLATLPGWERDGAGIKRTYSFKNYYHTVSFVNAVAWLAHREDHHPTITFDYKTCSIWYGTHAIGGLTENDFICAAKIDALLL